MKREHEITLIVSGSLAIAILVLFLLNFNFLVSPAREEETTKTIVVFRWLGFANKVFIDNNPDFLSARIVEAAPGRSYTITELEPGEYYWKTNGISTIQGFVVESEAAVEIEDSVVKNKGNVPLIIEFFNKLGITGHVTLDVNQEKEFDEKFGNVFRIVAGDTVSLNGGTNLTNSYSENCSYEIKQFIKQKIKEVVESERDKFKKELK